VVQVVIVLDADADVWCTFFVAAFIYVPVDLLKHFDLGTEKMAHRVLLNYVIGTLLKNHFLQHRK
jgi:hypothetical protein